MQLRWLRDWKGNVAGRVFDSVSDGAAELLLKRGLVEQVEAPESVDLSPQPAAIEEAKPRGGRKPR